MDKAGKKVVLITGGTSGIGLASAALFLQDGWQVAVMGRDDGRGQAALDYLKKNAGSSVNAGEAVYLQGDVSRAEDCRRAVADTAWQLGRLDALINSAGI